MRYGIQTLSPRFFGGAPDIAVAGFNVGGNGLDSNCRWFCYTNIALLANLGLVVLFSGTVGAATEAVKKGLPM